MLDKPLGRPLLDLDKKLQLYVQKVREVVSSKVVIAEFKSIDNKLEDDEAGSGMGYICLNRHWAYSFLRSMEKKSQRLRAKYSVADFYEVI